MKIKSQLGKIFLKNSSSHQYYIKQYQNQIQTIKQQQKTINHLKEQENRYKEIINKKNKLIKELKNQNNEMIIKNTQDNKIHNETIKKINTTYELELNQKNNQIKQLQDKNTTLTGKINNIENTLNSYEQGLINKENGINNNLQLIKKDLNYLTIKLDSKFNENERKLVSELDNFNKKLGAYLITIVVPVYNVEKYVEKCFLSILRQTIGFHNLEIIFVDDCSTDNSYEILREYANNYMNVRVFQTDENSGVAGKPRNIGMEHASSDYIIFLDADDEFYDDACKVLYEKIVESGSSLVSGTYTLFSTVNNREEIPLGLFLDTFTDNNLTKDERIKNLEQIKQKYPQEIEITDIHELPYIINNYMITKIFNLKFLRDNEITFPEYILAEDSVFIYNSFVSAEKLVFIQNPIFKYTHNRNHAEDMSVTHSNDSDFQISRLKAYNMIYDLSLEKGLEDITAKYLINLKMTYFFNQFVLGKNLSHDVLIEIFNKSKNLCEVLIREDIVLQDNLNELFSKIVNEKYTEAISLC